MSLEGNPEYEMLLTTGFRADLIVKVLFFRGWERLSGKLKRTQDQVERFCTSRKSMEIRGFSG